MSFPSTSRAVPRALIFSAGKIARGFLAHLLSTSGYSITFVERNPELTRTLRERGRYTVEIMGSPEKSAVISGYNVLHVSEADAIARAVAEADVVFVSVGGPNLPEVAPFVAAGLALVPLRMRPLNVILGENYFQPGRWLRELVEQYLEPERREWSRSHVGFVETMILRSTIEPTEEMKARDPLSLKAQDMWEIPADGEAIVGEFPLVLGLMPKAGFQSSLTRKLYTYNNINAVLAYGGALKGLKLLSEAAHDSELVERATTAYREASGALCKEYGFDAQEQDEFARAALSKYQDRRIVDPIERNARDPLRKLAPHDRLVGPAVLAARRGARPAALAEGIASALCYDVETDPSSVRLQEMLRTQVLPVTLETVCGLLPGTELAGLVTEAYLRMQDGGRNRPWIRVP